MILLLWLLTVGFLAAGVVTILRGRPMLGLGLIVVALVLGPGVAPTIH